MPQECMERTIRQVEVEGWNGRRGIHFLFLFFPVHAFPPQILCELDVTIIPIYYSPYDGQLHEGYMYTDNGFWDTFQSTVSANALLHPKIHGQYVKITHRRMEAKRMVAIIGRFGTQLRNGWKPCSFVVGRCLGGGYSHLRSRKSVGGHVSRSNE